MSASPQALAAVRAWKNARRWGRYATQQFLTKHKAWDHFLVLMDSHLRRMA